MIVFARITEEEQPFMLRTCAAQGCEQLICLGVDTPKREVWVRHGHNREDAETFSWDEVGWKPQGEHSARLNFDPIAAWVTELHESYARLLSSRRERRGCQTRDAG